jgi:ribonuclease BN (tRNA processing enzyme)
MAPQARIGFGDGRSPPPPEASVQTIELKPGVAAALPGGINVTAAVNSHFDDQSAEAPQSFSYRFEVGGRTVSYTGDTGPSEAVEQLARGSDLLVSEVVDLDPLVRQIDQSRKDASPEMLADLKRHLSTHHLTPEQVGHLAAKAGVRAVLLTHFAAPPGPLAKSAMINSVRARFRGPVEMGQDLHGFELSCAGELAKIESSGR